MNKIMHSGIFCYFYGSSDAIHIVQMLVVLSPGETGSTIDEIKSANWPSPVAAVANPLSNSVDRDHSPNPNRLFF